jgi:DNA-binding CsgD family transcriptional regulator
MSFYLNHGNVLNKFCLYFKERAHKIIHHANHNAIIFPEHNNMIDNDNPSFGDFNLQNLNNALAVKTYYMNDQYDGIRLSKREIQCLVLYLKGNTTVQIGNRFNLCKSTVDNFLFTLKKKFKFRTRSELIELFWDLGILKSNGWFDI